MEKLVYLIFRSEGRSDEELRDALIGPTALALRAGGATRIDVNVSDAHVTAGSEIVIRKRTPALRAMVSFWLPNADDRGACEVALREQADELHGYLVAESECLVNDPPEKTRARGFKLVGCINRRKDISRDEFFHVWHGHHKRIAIETQSTFGYVRNVVVRGLTPEAPDWDGVVEDAL